MTLYGKSFAHFLILFLTFCSSIQKQISSSSAARKIIALSLIKISLLYMEAKKIYEVRTLNCHKLLALISCKELLQRCYTLFPYSLIIRCSRSWSSFLYYLLVASFFAWLSFLFLFFLLHWKGDRFIKQSCQTIIYRLYDEVAVGKIDCCISLAFT